MEIVENSDNKKKEDDDKFILVHVDENTKQNDDENIIQEEEEKEDLTAPRDCYFEDRNMYEREFKNLKEFNQCFGYQDRELGKMSLHDFIENCKEDDDEMYY